MKFLAEFRSKADAQTLVKKIHSLPLSNRRITLMEVCGSHTMAIHKFGIRQLLPEQIRLISGPGCPVCVTGTQYIDRAIAIARRHGVTLATFGDMMKVPGSRSTLTRERAAGVDVRAVYSTLDALKIARLLPNQEVVFLGIGFETTSPTVAASLHQARQENLTNYAVLTAHKLIPPAMAALAADPEVGVDGFLCPAHVSAVIGSRAYEFLPREHGLACAVAGFEPLDILQGVYLLARQIMTGQPRVENEYSRVVRPEGNPTARRLLEDTFEVGDDYWRGLGIIPGSGHVLRPQWQSFDAACRFPVELPPIEEPQGCLCGQVLRGTVNPDQCPLFAHRCTPETPVGACMVSSEGTCAAWFKYQRAEDQ